MDDPKALRERARYYRAAAERAAPAVRDDLLRIARDFEEQARQLEQRNIASI